MDDGNFSVGMMKIVFPKICQNSVYSKKIYIPDNLILVKASQIGYRFTVK